MSRTARELSQAAHDNGIAGDDLVNEMLARLQELETDGPQPRAAATGKDASAGRKFFASEGGAVACFLLGALLTGGLLVATKGKWAETDSQYLKEKISTYEAQVSELNNNSVHRADELASLGIQLASVTSQLGTATTRVENLEHANAVLQKENEDLKAKLPAIEKPKP